MRVLFDSSFLLNFALLEENLNSKYQLRRCNSQATSFEILEQFVDTLQIFQKMLPGYYSGVIDIWNSDFLQAKRNSTKTMNRKELSLDARKFLILGPLKFETDLYIFIRALFNERLRRHNITPHEVQTAT
jgi:hypothetical protein